jgi:hypothetical protein
MPTNQVFGVPYQTNLTLSVVANAPGMNNGFPLNYQWLKNGNNISGANAASYNFNGLAGSSDTYSVLVTNAVGSVSAGWSVTVTNAINVSNDLLLIYNSNSADSSNLCAYYLAHRPMVGGANVLGVACDTNEIISLINCDAQIVAPVTNWLTNNPTKRPQYVVLFFDMPTRIQPVTDLNGSVGWHLRQSYSNWQPFVTYINGGTRTDCEAYIDKVAYFGTNYSPGQLNISASAGNYGNTNYYFDDSRDPGFAGPPSLGNQAKTGVLGANSAASVTYTNGNDNYTNLTIHLATGTNVSGYLCWGAHSAMGLGYATNGFVNWSGNSRWWIIETVESWNGQRYTTDQGNFIKWFSSNAFGGTNYSNTPVGAVCHVEEPNLSGVENSSVYFGLWAGGVNFAISSWNSRQTPFFQAIGDPFINK